MKKHNHRPLLILSITILLLTVFASGGGIMLSGLYRDNPFVTLVWRSTDWATLVVAVPIFTASIIMSLRGLRRAHLVWLAMLDYTLYNYSYYLFAAAFNWFFLIYVALFVFSIAALIIGLMTIDVRDIQNRFRENTPVKWISGYMLFVAVGLTTVYLIVISGFIVTGQTPAMIDKTGHPTNMIFALDLSLVVPVFFLGAIWLLKRQPWGYILAAISTLKAAVYMLVLTILSFAAAKAGYSDSACEIPVWLSLSAGGLIASILLLGNMKNVKGEQHVRNHSLAS